MDNEEKIKEYEAHQTPVPSYEKWQASYNCMLENEVLRLKNAQLKERVSKLEKMQYSYTPEEWNIMLKTVNHTREQNAQLKELLKECKECIEWYKADCGYQDAPTNAVLTKIDEVLR